MLPDVVVARNSEQTSSCHHRNAPSLACSNAALLLTRSFASHVYSPLRSRPATRQPPARNGCCISMTFRPSSAVVVVFFVMAWRLGPPKPGPIRARNLVSKNASAPAEPSTRLDHCGCVARSGDDQSGHDGRRVAQRAIALDA